MKKAIVSFVLSLMFPLVLFADGYTSLWKQYNEAETKDLPKTQIKILNKIIAQAKAGKSYGNLLKAEFDKVATASGISDELFQSELSALKKAAGEASAVDPALAAVYNCALGCSYSLVKVTTNLTARNSVASISTRHLPIPKCLHQRRRSIMHRLCVKASTARYSETTCSVW